MSRIFLSGLVALLGLAACSDTSRLPTAPETEPTASRVPSSAAHVTASARWSQRTRAIIGRQKVSSNGSARLFALVSVAQYDAVIAARKARSHGRRPSESGAASAAAAGVLAALYPLEQAFIETQLAEDAAYFTIRPWGRKADFEAGVEVGRTVAAAVVAYAATDGSNVPWDGTLKTGPGYWTPTSLPPQDATWGGIRPWIMTSGDQFHSPPPPSVDSPILLADLAEVRQISDNRTPEQEEIARFWASGYGPGGPAGFFGSVAVAVAEIKQMNEYRAARMFAVMHMAIMDASIGCYEAKYSYWSIRPYQVDPMITIPTGVSKPNFPSYPSAHSCLSSAAAGVLSRFYPEAAGELREMVDQAGDSRIYGGIHFRFEITAGQDIGYAVARLALRRAPRWNQPIALN